MWYHIYSELDITLVDNIYKPFNMQAWIHLYHEDQFKKYKYPKNETHETWKPRNPFFTSHTPHEFQHTGTHLDQSASYTLQRHAGHMENR